MTMDTTIQPRRGRRPEFEERHIDIIADAYRRGATKTAAANAAGFCQETVRKRLIAGEKNVEDGNDTLEARLFLAVEEAEAACELRCQDSLNRAMDGYDTEVVRETVKTFQRTYKTKHSDGNTIERVICRTVTHPDGRVEEIPVEFEEAVRETVKGREFDWRSAESWLKRRRRGDYGDRQDVTSNGETIQPAFIDLTDEERANRVNEIRERARPRKLERESGDGG
jgi:hypothetical protein